jgi:hypothetical protein
MSMIGQQNMMNCEPREHGMFDEPLDAKLPMSPGNGAKQIDQSFSPARALFPIQRRAVPRRE